MIPKSNSNQKYQRPILFSEKKPLLSTVKYPLKFRSHLATTHNSSISSFYTYTREKNSKDKTYKTIIYIFSFLLSAIHYSYYVKLQTIHTHTKFYCIVHVGKNGYVIVYKQKKSIKYFEIIADKIKTNF